MSGLTNPSTFPVWSKYCLLEIYHFEGNNSKDEFSRMEECSDKFIKPIHICVEPWSNEILCFKLCKIWFSLCWLFPSSQVADFRLILFSNMLRSQMKRCTTPIFGKTKNPADLSKNEYPRLPVTYAAFLFYPAKFFSPGKKIFCRVMIFWVRRVRKIFAG